MPLLRVPRHVVRRGALSFARSALALTAAIPNADAAPPIVNATILPLLFLSGIFIPLGDDAPQWITTVGDIFPVKHFADAMRAGFLGNVMVPGRAGAGVPVRLERIWSSPRGVSSGWCWRPASSAGNRASRALC